MSACYVDTSAVVAVLLGEPGAGTVRGALARYSEAHSSNLLEAELRSVLAREGIAWERASASMTGWRWVYPDRSLGEECQRILAKGFLHGSDLWHVACALYLAPGPGGIDFVTLDRRQAKVASAVGLRTVGVIDRAR